MYGVRVPLCGIRTRHDPHPYGMLSECPGCPADQAELIRLAISLATFNLLTEPPIDPKLELRRVLQMHPSVHNAMWKWGDYPGFGQPVLGDTAKWLGTELKIDPSMPKGTWRIVFDHGSIAEEVAVDGHSSVEPE